MGEVIERIVIKLLPTLEVTVKGTDIEMLEEAAIIISDLKKKEFFPDVEIVPSEEIRKTVRDALEDTSS